MPGNLGEANFVSEPTVSPAPASVPYNDWRKVPVAPLATFAPSLPVSVVIPSYRTPPETLARTLAGLESQTYPRHLFEVVIVDDGTEPPLALPSTSLDVKVVRQERRGFGRSRARNAGIRAAAHGILLFLDSDMLVEANWIEAHARWHHAVADTLTVGFRVHVAASGIDSETIRRRAGSLAELLAGRPVDHTPGIDEHLAETNDLASRADDPFRVVIGANCGIGKDFCQRLGGMDESFVRWGLEDVEFGYRAYVHGGLLVPVREASAWHQGRWNEHRDAKRRSARIQTAKAAHLIAHWRYRGDQPGRLFRVPQFVVSVDGQGRSTDQIVDAVATILAGCVDDLVVRVEPGVHEQSEEMARLREEFGPDPRVRVAPTCSFLEQFPSSPFHITLPARVYAKNLVRRLRAQLGDAVVAVGTLADGATVSITRTWALHRARRTGKSPAAFGEARTISIKALGSSRSRRGPAMRLLAGFRRIRSIQAASILRRATAAARAGKQAVKQMTRQLRGPATSRGGAPNVD